MPAPSLDKLQALRRQLCSAELDQAHLFTGWPAQESESLTPPQVALLEELHAFAQHYPGGVTQYIRNGKRLLEADRGKKEEAPEEGDDGDDEGTSAIKALEMPSLVFHAPDLYTPSPELAALERRGAELAQKCVFVLVAGGLGERLGYSSIKVGLPVETATMRTYLEHYLSWAKAAGGPDTPFVLMTSNDTHSRTVELLEALQPNMPNLRLLKQDTVFCFADADAHLAVGEDGALVRKPHGHGDVHSLLFSAKVGEGSSAQPLIDSWLAKGYEYIAFLQDTNAPATVTIPISLAVSERERLDMNFTCIPRQPKEAIGLLCRTLRRMTAPGPEGAAAAVGKGSDVWRTSVVEYNVFEGAAARLTEEGGDVPAHGSEYSPFPGSINTLVFRLASYAARLTASHGAVPEFINPKYADASRWDFKKPARVESLMQDFALLFPETDSRVGGTVFDRFTYQPVKNALASACAAAKQGMAPYCATTGEEGFYELTRRRLAALGVAVEHPRGGTPDVVVGGSIAAHLFPIVTLDACACAGGRPRAIGGLGDLARVFPYPDKVIISAKSTLLIEGRVIVESLELNGAAKLVGPPLGSEEPPLTVRGLRVENEAWHARETTSEDVDEVHRIRGFVLEKPAPELVGGPSANL